MLLVDEEDLVVLCSKLKLFQSKLLRKWLQGLAVEQRAAAFMKDASAAKNHSSIVFVSVRTIKRHQSSTLLLPKLTKS